MPPAKGSCSAVTTHSPFPPLHLTPLVSPQASPWDRDGIHAYSLQALLWEPGRHWTPQVWVAIQPCPQLHVLERKRPLKM